MFYELVGPAMLASPERVRFSMWTLLYPHRDGFQSRMWGKVGAERKCCDDGHPTSWLSLLGLSLPLAQAELPHRSLQALIQQRGLKCSYLGETMKHESTLGVIWVNEKAWPSPHIKLHCEAGFSDNKGISHRGKDQVDFSRGLSHGKGSSIWGVFCEVLLGGRWEMGERAVKDS